jgi:hypothetical protein
MAAKGEGEKSLEMRVAELEDKLKGMQISEEEMRAYNKVSAMMGGLPQAAAASEPTASAAIPAPDNCVIQQCIQQCVRPCTVVHQCTIVSQCVRPCVIQQCIRACTIVQNCIRACTIISDCINECGGGCAPGGGGFNTGGFGSLGG